MTAASGIATQPNGRGIESGNDQAHDRGSDRPHYRVRPQDDGGTWRGMTEAAWTTRILRGARPPRPSAGMPDEASVPHG
jgi:hypothetical protein